jgi:hypothetical protein
MFRPLFAAVALCLSTATVAQTADLQNILSGKETPHSLKLKDLTAEWRHVAISSSDKGSGGGDAMKNLMQLGMMSQMGKPGGGNDAAGAMAAMSMLGGLFGGGGQESAPSYYTLGKTTSIAGESFLIAYRLEVKAPNLMELAAQSQKDGGKEPDFAKLAAAAKPTEDTELSLCLINLRSIGSLGSIRPFDLKKELEAAAKSGGGGLMDLFALGAKGADAAAPEPGATAVPDTRDMEFAINDARMAVKSDAQLSVKGNKIEVNNVDGNIVLKGTVTSARLKTRAENVVRNAMFGYVGKVPIVNQLLVAGGK